MQKGEAERLVQSQRLRDKEDIYYLRFEELREAVRTNRVDHELIRQRKDAFRAHQALTPPRVLAMLRNKKLENPWKKHDNIPL